MITYLSVLATVSLIALLGIVAYDLHAKRRGRFVAVRRKALTEAYETIKSLADVAQRAVEEQRMQGMRSASSLRHLFKTVDRAYFYGRAASFVASIPMDRL